MTHLYRRDNGRPIRDRMNELGLSCPTLADATRHVDPDRRGVSAAAIGNLAGRGSSAHDRCRLRTAWLISEVLNTPLQDLFSMHRPLTVTDERATPNADAEGDAEGAGNGDQPPGAAAPAR